jgi:hypothetical protein
MRKKENVMGKLTDFEKGLIAGIAANAIVFGIFIASHFLINRDKELIEYAEKIQAVEQLRDDYANTDPIECIDAILDVRRSVDGASAEFIRKRDEAVERFRGGLADR